MSGYRTAGQEDEGTRSFLRATGGIGARMGQRMTDALAADLAAENSAILTKFLHMRVVRPCPPLQGHGRGRRKSRDSAT